MSEKVRQESSTYKTKGVRNKGNNRVELVINGSVFVFLPGKLVKVPYDADIPEGLGLYVR